MPKGLAASCCDVFAPSIKLLYDEEYLHIPDALDLKRVSKLHKEHHGVHGMFGSLDCMHTPWKNCPKGWQVSFKSGKETCGPTKMLEALSDYHLWFWRVSLDYAGLLNDLNILNLSFLLELLVDGTFTEQVQSSMLVPFEVAEKLFHRLFVLVDRIYPPFSRFVKGIQPPLINAKQRYTTWQEASRKDMERAFGVLQSCFQVMTRTFLGISLKKLATLSHHV